MCIFHTFSYPVLQSGSVINFYSFCIKHQYLVLSDQFPPPKDILILGAFYQVIILILLGRQNKVFMDQNMVLMQVQQFSSATVHAYLYDDDLDKCIFLPKSVYDTYFLSAEIIRMSSSCRKWSTCSRFHREMSHQNENITEYSHQFWVIVGE